MPLVRFTALLLLVLQIFSANVAFAETSAGEADQGFTEAQAAYDRGDYATAITKWRELGDRGNAQAQYRVGHMILRAQGTNYDTGEARQWLERAAKGGVELAQVELADLLAGGLGVQQDGPLAAFWYEAAVKQGNVKAMRELAELYSGQKGVPVDEKKATALYKAAAERGDPKAQSMLAMRYGLGQGIRRDEYKAYLWQTISALTISKTDPAEAEATLFIRDWLKYPLSKRQKQAAELEAKKWFDKHVGKE
jgi:TPR repeat protein